MFLREMNLFAAKLWGFTQLRPAHWLWRWPASFMSRGRMTWYSCRARRDFNKQNYSSRAERPGRRGNMLSWRQWIATVGVLYFALTGASPSVAESGSTFAQSSIVIFWNAAKCLGGYHAELYAAHCDPGPSAAILDFNTKTQFLCVDTGAVDIRWVIRTDSKQGSPIPPSQVDWHPECWKVRLGFDVSPDTAILIPQYSQSPPPNYYGTQSYRSALWRTTPYPSRCCGGSPSG